MATTQNTYTGDNSTVSYSFTFPYLEETDIKVSLNGVVTTAYSLSNATTVTFDTAPGTGVAIRIYRDTNNDALAATFFAGSAIRAQDLNDDFLQNAYVTQEVKNRYLDKSTGGTITGDVTITGDFDVTGASSFTGNVDITGTLDMNANRILDVGTPTAGTDATNKTYVDTQDALKVAKAGDTMTGNLAMSNNKVTGLGTPSATTDATNKAYVDAYILTVYQGPQASDPTTRSGGSALQEGDLYFNTVEDVLKAYTGTEWVVSASAGQIVRWRKTAAGGETSLSGNDDGGSSLSYVVGNEQVFLNGVLQQRGVDYTASTGTSITGLTALTAGDIVELHAVQGYTSGIVSDGSITSAKIANDTIVNADVNSSAGIVATKLSFTQSGTGAVARTVDSKLKDVVSVKDFGAVGDGTTDDTAAIQAAIDSLPSGGGHVYIPRGLYLVDPATGINVVEGLTLSGAGRLNTQLVADTNGGAVIKRQFNDSAANSYLRHVTIRDLGIILRHPATAAEANYDQVAIQLRHITRSLVEDVYIGNYPQGVSSALTAPTSQANARQGYGISIGSTSASDTAYAGGEVNTCRNVLCNGVRYGITLDNSTFDTPYGGSAAYGCVIDSCEVSIAEVAISQYGQYGSGCTFSNNVIQSIDQMNGSVATAYSYLIEGKEHIIHGGYHEAPNTDYELYLGSSSARNRILPWLTDDGTVSDNGSGNVIERISGTTDKWSLKINNRDLQNGIADAYVNFYWNGSAIVINSSYNVNSVTRNGTGDYTINLGAGIFGDANYTAAFSGRVNASGHAGAFANYNTKSTSAYRVTCRNVNSNIWEDFAEVTATFWASS
jgi:hypothetical protein